MRTKPQTIPSIRIWLHAVWNWFCYSTYVTAHPSNIVILLFSIYLRSSLRCRVFDMQRMSINLLFWRASSSIQDKFMNSIPNEMPIENKVLISTTTELILLWYVGQLFTAFLIDEWTFSIVKLTFNFNMIVNISSLVGLLNALDVWWHICNKKTWSHELQEIRNNFQFNATNSHSTLSSYAISANILPSLSHTHTSHTDTWNGLLSSPNKNKKHAKISPKSSTTFVFLANRNKHFGRN